MNSRSPRRGTTSSRTTFGGTPTQKNATCQYDVAAGNTNGGGNKSNGVTVAPNPFPTGCIN
ncbi:MAG TPA: hypothetical protein VKG01_02540 [Thermoanaerobaculia bacterium]|nr:hypothetical protein [Thermoanaerobaculia bacterium]